MTTPHDQQPQQETTEPEGQPKRPHEVDQSVQFWFASLVMNFVGYVVSLFTPSEALRAQLRTSVAQSGMKFDGDAFAGLMITAQVLSALLYAGLCALWVLFILKMRAGKNWARAVLAALGWLSVVLAVPMLSADAIATKVFYLATSVITLVAVVLMFRGKAATYFVRKPPA